MSPVMNEPELDQDTADRLLEGGLAPDDAPQGYQDVARALHAATLMASEGPTQDADAAVAAFLAATPTRRTARTQKWKIAVATLAGGLTLSTGLAAADVLPGPAQQAASSALSHVGINVPDGDNNSTNVDTVKKTEDDTPTSTTHPDNHGSVVSDVARDESNVGADHGAAVCTTASDGKCQGGEDRGNASTSNSQSTRSGGSSNSQSSNSSANSGADNATSGSSNSSDTGASTSTGSSSTNSSGSSSSSGGSSSSGSSSSSSGSTSGSTSSSGSTSGSGS